MIEVIVSFFAGGLVVFLITMNNKKSAELAYKLLKEEYEAYKAKREMRVVDHCDKKNCSCEEKSKKD